MLGVVLYPTVVSRGLLVRSCAPDCFLNQANKSTSINTCVVFRVQRAHALPCSAEYVGDAAGAVLRVLLLDQEDADGEAGIFDDFQEERPRVVDRLVEFICE